MVVGGVRGVDGGLGGELALGEAIQAVSLPREGNVVGDVGCFAIQLIRFDNEVADIPADCAEGHVTDRGRSDGGDQHSRARPARPVDGGDHRAEDERCRDHQQSGEHHVGVGVGDAVEDGVMFQLALEPAEVDVECEQQQ